MYITYRISVPDKNVVERLDAGGGRESGGGRVAEQTPELRRRG